MPQTPTPSNSSQLDPQAVDLAKAIRQKESGGNFSASGKSGEFGGYQWTPDSWSNMSQEAGVNVPLQQATPSQQNEVAYKQIKSWKDSGFNVAQIASMWNAGKGEPDAYMGHFSDNSPSTGKNDFGVDYNVPQYAEDVVKNYQSLKQANPVNVAQSQQTQQTQQQEPSVGEKILQAFLPSTIWEKIKGNLATAAPVAITAALAPELLPSLGSAGAATQAPGLISRGIGAVKSALGVFGLEKAAQGVTGLIAGTPDSQQPGAISDTSQIPQQSLLQDFLKSTDASSKVKDILTQAMQGTQSNRILANSQPGKEGLETMGLYGYTPDTDTQGNMNFENAKKKSDKNESLAAQIEGIAAGDSKVPMMSVLNEAGKYIGSNRLLPNDVRGAIADKVREYADSVAPSNQSISGEEAISQRHANYAIAKKGYGKLSGIEIEARKAFAHGLRQASINVSKNPELQNAAIAEQRRHINARQIMKRLEQKKAPGEPSAFKTAVFKAAARYAEAYIGEKIGGPVGGILGLLAGEHINRRLAKHLTKTKFDTPQMKAALDILHDTKPDAYKMILARLKENEVDLHPKEIKDVKGKSTQKLIKDVKTGKLTPMELDRLVNRLRGSGLVATPKTA